MKQKLQGVNVFIGNKDIKDNGASCQYKNGWGTARRIGWFGFWHRIDCTLKVLFGYADIVIWKD